MTDRPIIFTGEMIRAILAGRKTQTRRLHGLEDVNNYPGLLVGDSPLGPLGYRGVFYYTKKPYKKDPDLFHWFMGMSKDGREINPIPVKCPYGQPGDRLWVKETWATPGNYDDFKPSDLSIHMLGSKELLAYKATEQYPIYYHWRTPLFMPRWASRITLEITGVRVERVQSISHNDACVEGAPSEPEYNNRGTGSIYVDWYADLWDTINGKEYPWVKNPWVWVLEFKVV